ncbi:MAG TPA: prepilin peptidase [Candidatus Elarobacter sp.]|jgi:prepilin signal peptidase PulO-like enzyme (type II secretory pathway)
MIIILLAMVAFAGASALGLAAARSVCGTIAESPAGGPPPGVVPQRLLVIGAAVMGAAIAFRGLPLPALAIAWLACGLLTAIWASDVVRGIIPDMFTIVPLGAILLAAALAGHYEVLIAAVVPAVPFAFLAWRSGGLGLGWGDVKLAMLGGPLIGMQHALMAFAIGCLAAVVVARIRKVSHQPVAFAPYLASSIALPLAFGIPGF